LEIDLSTKKKKSARQAKCASSVRTGIHPARRRFQ
jgi:hypothetical protein